MYLFYIQPIHALLHYNDNNYDDKTLGKKAIIHRVTTMLATSKNVLFPGPNHLLTTGGDDPSL